MKRTPEQKKVTRYSRLRALRAGGYSSFAAVIVILIAVIANMAMAALPSNITKIDFTQQSIYSLSDQTKRIVSTIEKPVTLTLIATKGQEDSAVKTLLERYKSLSGKISIEYVDPTVTPGILKQYENEDLRQNSVIVKSDSRDRFVSYSDIYVYNYTMDYQSYNYDYTVDFNGENALTSAIHYVTSAELPKLYTLKGHGETALSDSVLSLIKSDNMESEGLSLLTGDTVPEDASCVIINLPTSDLSEDEAKKLIAYLDGGGKITLCTSYIAAGEMKNLLNVTSHMGVTVAPGIIIETDQSKYLRGYGYYLLPTLDSHEITDPLISAGYYALMPIAQGITKLEDTQAVVTALLTTSDGAFSKASGYDMTVTDREQGDMDGPFDVSVTSEIGDGKLVWFASDGMMSDDVNSMVSGGNYNLLMNAIGWMCERTESVSIRAKSLDEARLTLTGQQSALYSTLFVGVIPMMLIAFGIAIWYRRKHV